MLSVTGQVHITASSYSDAAVLGDGGNEKSEQGREGRTHNCSSSIPWEREREGGVEEGREKEREREGGRERGGGVEEGREGGREEERGGGVKRG